MTWIKGYQSNKSTILTPFRVNLELGTPQGGILGPTLFNNHKHRPLNSIEVSESESICYADDIYIITHFRQSSTTLPNKRSNVDLSFNHIKL